MSSTVDLFTITGSIEEVGTKSYVAAEPTKKTSFCESFRFIMAVLWDGFLSNCKIMILIIKEFFLFFIPKRKKDISGKLALITGSGNGLGRAIAIELARHKCNIVIVDVDLQAAENTATDIRREFNVKCKAYKVDVSDYDEIVTLKNKIENDMGIVEILVNNAGLLPLISLFEGDNWRDYERILKVNLHSHLWTTKVFFEGMKKQKSGHIVAIASILGISYQPYTITYSTTKHGVVGFMRSLTTELEAEKLSKYIKTTTICPYFINTRKSVLDNLRLRFPALDAEYVAEEIVLAIRKNVESKIIARMAFVLKILFLLPRHIQAAASKKVSNPRKIRNWVPKK